MNAKGDWVGPLDAIGISGGAEGNVGIVENPGLFRDFSPKSVFFLFVLLL